MITAHAPWLPTAALALVLIGTYGVLGGIIVMAMWSAVAGALIACLAGLSVLAGRALLRRWRMPT